MPDSSPPPRGPFLVRTRKGSFPAAGWLDARRTALGLGDPALTVLDEGTGRSYTLGELLDEDLATLALQENTGPVVGTTESLHAMAVSTQDLALAQTPVPPGRTASSVRRVASDRQRSISDRQRPISERQRPQARRGAEREGAPVLLLIGVAALAAIGLGIGSLVWKPAHGSTTPPPPVSTPRPAEPAPTATRPPAPTPTPPPSARVPLAPVPPVVVAAAPTATAAPAAPPSMAAAPEAPARHPVPASAGGGDVPAPVEPSAPVAPPTMATPDAPADGVEWPALDSETHAALRAVLADLRVRRGTPPALTKLPPPWSDAARRTADLLAPIGTRLAAHADELLALHAEVALGGAALRIVRADAEHLSLDGGTSTLEMRWRDLPPEQQVALALRLPPTTLKEEDAALLAAQALYAPQPPPTRPAIAEALRLRETAAAPPPSPSAAQPPPTPTEPPPRLTLPAPAGDGDGASFVLIDIDTGKPIGEPARAGGRFVLDRAALTGRRYSMVIVPDRPIDLMLIRYAEISKKEREERTAPYSLIGDDAGVLRPWTPSPGEQRIVITLRRLDPPQDVRLRLDLEVR